MSENARPHPQMNALRFVQITQSYGAQAQHWPEQEREQALAFAARFDSARDIMRGETALDEALSCLTAPPPSDLLAARILKSARGEGRPDPQDKARAGLIKPWGYGLAAMLIGGFLAFGLMPPRSNDSVNDEAYLSLIAAENLAQTLTEDEIAQLLALPETPAEFVQSDLDSFWDDIILAEF